jgi:ribosomal protein S18 acetylase RimI-like enzyme
LQTICPAFKLSDDHCHGRVVFALARRRIKGHARICKEVGPVQGVAITKATLDDAYEILELQKLAYQSEAKLYNDFTIPPLTQTLEELQAEFGSMVILKAMVGSRIGGSVRAHEKDGTCHIGRLIVHPKVQRRGLGSQLLAAIEGHFPGVKRYELFTGQQSFGNLLFYAQVGYKKCRERKMNERLTMIWLSKLNK